MNKLFKHLIWPIIAIPMAYLAIVWNDIPGKVAIHFRLDGTPDRYGSKSELLTMILILTAINSGLYLLLAYMYRLDPKKNAAINKTRLQRMGFAISVFVAAMLCVIIYTSMKPDLKFSTGIIFAGVGFLFCFIGNYMHNIKPNYFAGIRVPWTLKNEDNWRKTHLLAGKIFFAGGLLIAIVCLIVPAKTAVLIFFIITAIITLIPFIYSYRLYKQQKHFQNKN